MSGERFGHANGDTEQWRFPSVKLTEEEKKEIVATVILIATKFMFSSHLYTFAGKTYRQKTGGPIGLRGTCAIARLVMQMWDRKWLDRLARLKVVIWLAMRYMDDGRTFLAPFRPGWRWVDGDLLYCIRWEQEDGKLSPTERTKRILHATMQYLDDFLNFTMETSEDFPSGWLATLDTDLRIEENNTISYKYYEKPMASNVCVQKLTAMDENSKMKTLSNELTRRLLNTSEALENKVRVQIIDDYSQKLRNSGYELNQIRKIVKNGLKGYEKKLWESRNIPGRRLHRTAAQSMAQELNIRQE